MIFERKIFFGYEFNIDSQEYEYIIQIKREDDRAFALKISVPPTAKPQEVLKSIKKAVDEIYSLPATTLAPTP